jgi:hypothetical protein
MCISACDLHLLAKNNKLGISQFNSIFYESPSPALTPFLQDLARIADIKRIPTYNCYWDGQIVDTYEGGNLEQVNDLIARNLKEYDVSGGPLATALKIIAAAALIAGGTLVAKHFAPDKPDNGIVDPSTQILELKKRIMAAQGRLRNMERANRGKQARAQRKLIEQLNVQVRALEKASGKVSAGNNNSSGASIEATGAEATVGGVRREGHSGGGGGSSGTSTVVGGSRRGAPSHRKGGHGLDLDDVARLRRRKLRGEVLYSDEEDILISIESTPLVD